MLPFPGHIGLALIISAITGLNPLLLVIGACLPDLDMLFYAKYRYTRGNPHRAFSHSIFAPLILLPFSFTLTVGVISHIVADYFVYPGLRLFYPFKKKWYYPFDGDSEITKSMHEMARDLMSNKKRMVIEAALFIFGAMII